MDKELVFEAKDTKLKDILFTSYKKFRIPRYQRPYAWTEDQISDFWNDLTSDDLSNFFGSLIFNTEKSEETGFFDIIDGQQRLLTVTIFCAVLRDIARKIDAKKADLFQRKDIALEDNEGSFVNRIECGETLKSYFEEKIQRSDNDIMLSDGKTKEERLVKKNYLFFHDKINTILDSKSENSKKLDYLQTFRDKIHSLPVIQILIKSEDDAYEIFETTNARGVDLSVADLLKNVIFNKLRDADEKDIAKEDWNDIVTNVQDTNTELKKFIRYYWISKYSFVPEKKLFKEMKNTITEWDGLLDELHKASIWYDKLLIGNLDAWEDIKSGKHIFNSLRALRIMNVSQCYVLFLSILRNLERIGIDPKKVFEWVENFSFKYSAICKLPGNKLEKVYANYAKKIETIANEEDKKNISKKIQSTFEEFKRELKENEPGIEQFKEAFRDVSYGRSETDRHLCSYILNKINALYQPNEFDYASINIEHLLPQKPDKEWGLRKIEIKNYVNKLGNLTLVHKKINSSIGNKVMSQKIIELEKSAIYITRQIVVDLKKTSCKWGEEEIKKRHDALAEIAYKDAWVIK